MDNIFYEFVSHQIGGYKFKNPILLEQAFTRKSYTVENGGQNNEVLEFIGDKVLDICVVRYLSNKYGTDLHVQDKIPEAFRVPQKPREYESKLSEGELSKLKQKMVEKKALSKRIDDLGIAQFLRMGKGDVNQNMIEEPSVKEDLFEAILGAIAIDSNWNFDVLQNAVEIMLCPELFIQDKEEIDYVSLLYEWEAKSGIPGPWFHYYDWGPSHSWYFRAENVIYDNSYDTYKLNNYRCACEVKLSDKLPYFQSYGLTKNEARASVCRLAYNYLKRQGLLFTIKDEIDNPNLNDAINQLEILARRKYFSIPVYASEESHDEDGNPIWHTKCIIKEYKRSFSSVSSSKKSSKKEAAFKMLNYILENYDDESQDGGYQL